MIRRFLYRRVRKELERGNATRFQLSVDLTEVRDAFMLALRAVKDLEKRVKRMEETLDELVWGINQILSRVEAGIGYLWPRNVSTRFRLPRLHIEKEERKNGKENEG